MFSRYSLVSQWFLLLILSLVMGCLLYHWRVPAALLLGPMLAGLIMSLNGCSVRIPLKLFIMAQAILGCLIAQNLSHAILAPLLHYWPYMIVMTLLTLGASTIAGWFLVRYSSLPGTTGAWGTSPGGASAMVAMSMEYGADMRLVAFIQYARVLMVISITAIVAHYLAASEVQAIHHELIWFPPLTPQLFITLLIAMVGAYIGRRFSIPSGAMLIPLALGSVLHNLERATLELPQWLLAIAYLIIGLMVGLRFNIAVFRLALRAIPQIIFSMLILILLCALFALLLSYSTGIDFLSAFLATSPGGLDTVAIIAAGTGTDLPLIIAMQTLRLLSVLFIGPFIAQFLARYAKVSH